MGDFRKKISCRLISMEKNILQENTGRKKCPALKKKMSLMLHRYVSFYVWGKPKTKSSILAPPPPPPSSNGNRTFLQRNSFVCLTAPNAYQQGQ